MCEFNFFNKPVGKQMKTAFLIAGFLCVCQIICMFLPFGEYTESVSMMGESEIERRFLLGLFDGAGIAFLGAADFIMLFVATIMCFVTKSDKEVGRGKRFFLLLVIILYIICLVAAISTLNAQEMRLRTQIQEQLGKGADELYEIYSKLLWGAYLAIIVSVIQITVIIFAIIKSKANNLALKNSPERKIATYTKLLKDGVLTQEEYEEKVRQVLSLNKTEIESK